MKLITLTRGQFAIVDDDIFDYLNQWKWYARYNVGNKCFYAVRWSTINGKRNLIGMHRVILNITDAKVHGDHINHDTLDNRCCNIRIATPAQNSANRHSHKNSTSKFIGVGLDRSKNKWRAYIMKNGKKYNLGSFSDEYEAAKARDAAAKKLHGEFANLNFKTAV